MYNMYILAGIDKVIEYKSFGQLFLLDLTLSTA